jgi:flavin-dependent dehydrogenase
VSDFDVLIAGAGPAACAAAISLAALSTTLKVCVVGVPRPEGPPPIEVLSPLVTPFFQHLGLWKAFAARRHDPSFCISSAWNAPSISTHDSVFSVHGPGWRIDRAAFDAWLAAEAAPRSAVFLPERVAGLQYESDGWSVECGAAGQHRARLVVDATGRAAVLARKLGYRPVAHDGLTAYFQYMDSGVAGPDGLLIESVPEGWWYTAALSNGRGIIVCMTDSDIGRQLGLRTPAGWGAARSRTRFVAALARAFTTKDCPHVCPAYTRSPFAYSDRKLLCIGDASACFDPISGQGTVRAIRSGLFASYAIADILLREDDSGVRRFHAFHSCEYASYRQTLKDYYCSEHRWPDHLFWRRRQTQTSRDHVSFGPRRGEKVFP